MAIRRPMLTLKTGKALAAYRMAIRSESRGRVHLNQKEHANRICFQRDAKLYFADTSLSRSPPIEITLNPG